MELINHNISSANDGLGDQLRTAFENQNTMNSELYTETGQLRTELIAAATGASGKSIVPTSTPDGTGIKSWIATQAGTYTNFGGVVVNTNSFAVISRDANGAFSISQTALTLTDYQKKTDNVKIENWTANAYLSGDQVNYLGKDWTPNAVTLSTDIPNTSTKWVERLTAYKPETLVDKTNTTKSVTGKAVDDYLAVKLSTALSFTNTDGVAESVDGYYSQGSGNFNTYANSKSKKYTITQGVDYYATATLFNDIFALAIYYDVNGTFISSQFRGAVAGSSYARQKLTIPTNAVKIGISSYNTGAYGKLESAIIAAASTEQIATLTAKDVVHDALLSDFKTKSLGYENVTGVDETIDMYYGKNSGNLSFYSLARSRKYTVNESDTYYASAVVLNSALALAIYFNSSNVYIGFQFAGTSLNVYTRQKLTLPVGTKYIGISSYNGGLYGTLEKEVIDVASKEYVNTSLNTNYWKDKKIVWLGTSIPAGSKTVVTVNNITVENNYPKMLANLLGCTVYNEAIGGSPVSFGNPTKIGVHDARDIMGVQGKNWFSTISALGMNLIEKEHIITNKAYYQSILTSPEGQTDQQIRDYSFENVLVKKYLTASATVARPDLFILDHGFNDLGNYLPTTQISNYVANERMRFWGGMNYLIRKILEDNPNAKIIIVTHYSNSGVQTLPIADLIKTQQDLGTFWNIPVINIHEKLQINNNEQIYTQGYWDINGIWQNTGFTFTDNGNNTFTTNDKGYLSTLSYATVIASYDVHQVQASEDIAKIFPVGTWVYKYNRIPVKMKDNLHPHSDKSGKLNYKIAMLIASNLKNENTL